MKITDVPAGLSSGDQLQWLIGIVTHWRAHVKDAMREALTKLAPSVRGKVYDLALEDLQALGIQAARALPDSKPIEAIEDAFGAAVTAMWDSDVFVQYPWMTNQNDAWMRFVSQWDPASDLSAAEVTVDQLVETITALQRCSIRLRGITWIVPDSDGKYFFPNFDRNLAIVRGDFVVNDDGSFTATGVE